MTEYGYSQESYRGFIINTEHEGEDGEVTGYCVTVDDERIAEAIGEEVGSQMGGFASLDAARDFIDGENDTADAQLDPRMTEATQIVGRLVSEGIVAPESVGMDLNEREVAEIVYDEMERLGFVSRSVPSPAPRMTSQHTPGPWGISDGCDGQAVVGTFDTDEHGPAIDVCGVYTSEADAALIAAAPELLAVARWAESIWSTLAETGDFVLRERYAEHRDEARAALAKAEGR